MGKGMKASIRQATISGLKWALWLAVSSVVTMPAVFAQNYVEPWVEYHKQLEGTEHIAALEEGFAGDSVSLYDGATTFSVTDISIPGNFKLPVQLVRRVSIELQVQGVGPYDTRLGGAGNWDVDVPYMTATYPSPNAYPGSPGWQAQRCSGRSSPDLSLPPPFWDSDVWSGINIHVPGRGDSKALALNASVPLPASGGLYHLTTPARDVLDCIPMQSGLSGEGFRLTTASGVQYYFDVGSTRVASTLTKWWSDAGRDAYMTRYQYYLLASKITDRFGNWVQFQYNGTGYPVRIWSSDGREIDLTYSGGQLASASSDGRTWQYQYDAAGNLTGVTLPDGSRWQYTYSGSLTPPMPPPGESFINKYCAIPPALIDDAYTLTATGPSGATASFQFQNTRHYRSGVVVNECINIGKPTSPIWYLRTPYFFDVMSLTQKTISGPGISTATWSYSYDATPAPLWGTPDGYNPYPCTTCRLDKTNSVTEPDGTQRRYQFGVEYALNDGRQLETDTVLGDGSTIIRSEANDYMSESAVSGQPFYPQYGDVLDGVGDPTTANIRPVVQSQISQDGATFTTTTNTFDSLARPLEQTESSSLGYSRTDETSYYDNSNKWVLDQVAQHAINGITAAATTYDAATALPLTYSAFGKLQQTLTWNADGTLASIKDGNNRVTTASNWKRGIPQAIGNADGTSESAVVNDAGWITAVMDENGFTTSYGYDAMGRLAKITYPSGDDVAWNKTLLSFTPAGTGEYNTPVGAWVQKVQTGNGVTNIYFDALWRPLVTEHYDSANKAATLSQTVTHYDAMGREIFRSYPANNISDYTTANIGTHTSYDALNRVTQVLQDSELGGLPTTTEYQTGFETKVTDPRGYSTTTSYQAFGEPDTSQPVSIAMPEGVTVTILRDAFGKPLTVKRSGSYDLSQVSLTRSFVYDANQLLCKRIEPETGAALFSYDGANNLVWSAPGTSLTGNTCDRDNVASSQMIVRGYDARNRLLSIAYPDGVSNTEYTYAADGAMLSAINHNGSSAVQTVYNYDERRLLTGEALSVPGASMFAIGYGYDANGHLGSLSYPDGRIITFAPNALGQSTQAGSYATGVSYFPNGAIKQFAYGDGSVHTLTQNLRGLPERSRDSYGPTAVLDNTAAYDSNGNVAGITDGLPGTVGNIDMSYDGLDRLTAATSPIFAGTHQANFTYDPLDNLRSAGVGNGNQYAYSYDPATNLLTSMTGSQTFDFGYDARGNVTHSNAQAYTFDMANRLVTANGLESYLYDAAGRRARKISAFTGSTTYYAYDKAGSLLYELDSGGTTSDYVYLGGSLVAKVSVVPPAPPPPPPAPASISVPASSSTGNVSISWSAVDGATGYALLQQFNGGSWMQVYTGSATSANLSGLANGSYVYRVQACNANGCGAFATSGTVIVDVPQPPPAPSSINVPASSSTGSITISWSSVGAATGYVLLQQFNGGSWTQVYSGSATSANLTGLANGSYVYRVQACNANGCGAFATSGTLTVALIPAPPASINVPASSYSPSLAVSWSASANTSNYVLEESVNGGGWGVAWNGNATSTTVTVSSSGTYRFQVSACGAGGCSGFTTSGNVAITLPPASAPSLSGPSSSTTGTFTLTWNAVAGATRYQLNQTLGGTVTTPYNAGGTSWTSSSRGNGTYSYQVFACNVAGCSPGSNVLAVTVQAVPIAPGPVAAPGSAYINVPFTVSWSAVSGATRYDLQQTDLGDGSVTTPYSGTATSKGITLSGPADTFFQYAARACNSAGCSAWVNAVRKTYLNYKTNPPAAPASGSSGP